MDIRKAITMVAGINNYVVCVAVMCLWFGYAAAKDPHFTLPLQRVHVFLHNEIQNKDLNVHCKSADDDIHWRVVPFNGTYEIKFKANLFGTTWWMCHIFWMGKDMTHYTRSNVFLYDYDLYSTQCDEHKCFWAARRDGLYFLNRSYQFKGKLKYHWAINKKKPKAPPKRPARSLESSSSPMQQQEQKTETEEIKAQLDRITDVKAMNQKQLSQQSVKTGEEAISNQPSLQELEVTVRPGIDPISLLKEEETNTSSGQAAGTDL